MAIPAAPAQGQYELVVKDASGAEIRCSIECVAYSEDIWKPVAINYLSLTTSAYNHKILVTFGTKIEAAPNGLKATVDNKDVHITGQRIDGNVIELNVLEYATDYKLTLSGVKYPDLFPSFSFTFTFADIPRSDVSYPFPIPVA